MLWKDRCETSCNIKQTHTFESFMTKKVYQINHSFNCDGKCLIHLFSCKVCGSWYVGSTVDRFQPRWSNYKSCQRHAADGGTTNQNYFHQHFLSDGHNGLMNDCEFIFKDKTDFSDPTRREFFWMRVLKTIAPSGLNIDEGYDYQFWSTTYSISPCDMLRLNDSVMIIYSCCTLQQHQSVHFGLRDSYRRRIFMMEN